MTSRKKFIQSLFLALGSFMFPKNMYSIPANFLNIPIPGLKKPLSVYINWASYDLLSDSIPLTQDLALKQFNELIRLKKLGVEFDYYLMDMFWFDKNGAYRSWDKQKWKNPDSWFNMCKDNGIKPGLWLSTNVLGNNKDNMWLNASCSEWQSSLSEDGLKMVLCQGDYLNHLIESMQIWYDKGVRLFKFDFANFKAANKELLHLYSQEEIIKMNQTAFYNALKAFRLKNTEVIFVAYNGFGGAHSKTLSYYPKKIELMWLDVFDSLYCGDPRPSDVPCFNLWRSKDIYSDYMVRQYQYAGVPVTRIDNSSFMIGNTGTCYNREKAGWKAMLILSLARNNWLNTYYGNLNLLDDTDAKWFAKAQQLYYPLQQSGKIFYWGGNPGSEEIYGYAAENATSGLYAVVNPSQKVCEVMIPANVPIDIGKVLFTEKGFKTRLEGRALLIGPEQMALVGFGDFADIKNDLGIDNTVIIPQSIRQAKIIFDSSKKNTLTASILTPEKGDLRFIFKVINAKTNEPLRLTSSDLMDSVLKIKLIQSNIELPIKINYNKKIWSGLSWASAEVKNDVMIKKESMEVVFTVISEEITNLMGYVYVVEY